VTDRSERDCTYLEQNLLPAAGEAVATLSGDDRFVKQRRAAKHGHFLRIRQQVDARAADVNCEVVRAGIESCISVSRGCVNINVTSERTHYGVALINDRSHYELQVTSRTNELPMRDISMAFHR
jgi:hypothetical protein